MKKITWFLLIATLAFGCEYIEGEGPIVKETLNIEDFDGINLGGSFDVEIEQGETQSIVAEGHGNIIQRLKREVRNNIWHMDLQNGNYHDYKLKIFIVTPDLTKATLGGSGNIYIHDLATINSELKISGSGRIVLMDKLWVENNTKLEINGSGDIEIPYLETTNLNANISGSGSIKVWDGEADVSEFIVSGSGNINALGCTVRDAEIRISGSGSCSVTATENLDVNISGSGNVSYKGYPDINTNISGSGNVRNKN